ncbi:MAG: pyridoxamine kinase [Clostridia bacterium]|nr:pyridoxamine kinase [Clostridia bacterium]
MERPVRTVAAVHDISGIGRCALTVAIPVISVMGAQVCPVPTACLSYHTGFTGKKPVKAVDLTDFVGTQLDAWAQGGDKFDCIYTGYLGSPAQAGLISEFFASQPAAMKLVDPVMGDDGVLYSGITHEMAEAMTDLCRHATVITPNLTEYAALTGEAYSDAPRTEAEIRRMLDKLPAEAAVITSVPMEQGPVNACRAADGTVSLIPFRTLSRHYPGTGDIFASVLCGALVAGEKLENAVERAAEFVSHAISISMDIDIDSNYGVQLEAALPALIDHR